MTGRPYPDAQRLVDALDNPAYVFNMRSLRFMAVNPAFEELLGYSRDELYAMTVEQIRPREDLPLLLNALKAHPPQHAVESRYLHRSGNLIYVRLVYRNMEYVTSDGLVPARFVSISQNQAHPTLPARLAAGSSNKD